LAAERKLNDLSIVKVEQASIKCLDYSDGVRPIAVVEIIFQVEFFYYYSD